MFRRSWFQSVRVSAAGWNQQRLRVLASVMVAMFASLWFATGVGFAQTTKNEPTNAAEQKAKEESELEEKYQAWVATLSPERRHWEEILQAELGSFQLPIHKREKVEERSNAWDFVQDDPALPRILLIGDSISRGYTPTVRKELAGKANVHRAPANCGPTANGVQKLDLWLGDKKWDIIHFNFGIHDRATPLEDYSKRLDELVTRMAGTGATLVWASTTPIPDIPDKMFRAASIDERNAAAAEVMQRHNVVTDDLSSAISPHVAEFRRPNDVHFTAKGSEFLGIQVARFLEKQIKR